LEVGRAEAGEECAEGFEVGILVGEAAAKESNGGEAGGFFGGWIGGGGAGLGEDGSELVDGGLESGGGGGVEFFEGAVAAVEGVEESGEGGDLPGFDFAVDGLGDFGEGFFEGDVVVHGGGEADEFFDDGSGRFGRGEDGCEHFADVVGGGTHDGDADGFVGGIADGDFGECFAGARVVPTAEGEGELVADADGRVAGDIEEGGLELLVEIGAVGGEV